MPRFVLLFLVLIALFNLSRVLREPLPDADRAMDFRTCYVGQAVLRAGQNPYLDATLKRGWQRIVQQENLTSRTQPGLPNLPFLYPPWAAALFGGSVGQLPYAVAWPLWGLLAVFSLGLIARLWPQVLRTTPEKAIPWWHFLLAALALKGTVPALLTGQPTFAALALGVGALAVSRGATKSRLPRLAAGASDSIASTSRNSALKTFGWPAILAGVLLGLAAFKVTLLLPFAAWFLWKKQWLPLAVAGGLVALLSAVAWHWAASPLDLLSTYQQLLGQVRAQSFDPTDPDYPLTQGLTLRVELGNVLEWLRPGSSAWHSVLHGLLWLGAGLRLWWLRRRGALLTDWYLFLVLSTLTLLTTYHLYYDAVLLLPLLAFAPTISKQQQGLLLALLLPLLLPLNGLALALGNPAELHFVYFLMPLALLGILGLLLARPVRAIAE
ncbi:glycosyltransferase family 87 protein [Hymenobacter sp. IS2118]|uniref:glycosyltransferase family 87 protein n=1 Tax=Hymenobacter sp. IS2118 TaxID=1505605 RepID=UPI0005555127|nr:glycosyltransferase family 87 protein [Hymenobacter sp. IS2118]